MNDLSDHRVYVHIRMYVHIFIYISIQSFIHLLENIDFDRLQFVKLIIES